MPKTESRIPKIPANQVFTGLGLFTLLSIFGAVWLQTWELLALPIVGVLLFAALTDFKNVYYSLFLLLPISMEMDLPGGFGTDFPSEPMMWFLMLCGLFYFFANPPNVDRDYFNHTVTKFLLLHILWILVAAIFANIFTISFKFFLSKIWYLTVFYFLTGYFVREAEDFKPIFWNLLIPLIAVTCIIIFRHSLKGFDFEAINRCLWPFFRNHVNYAVMLAIFLPFMVFIRNWYPKGKMARFIIDFGIIVFLFGIFFSYTRASYISVLLIPVGWLIFHFRMAKLAIVSGFMGMTFFLTFLIVGNNYINFAPDFERTIYHANFEDHLQATFALEDISTVERFYRWIAGFNMTTENPVTGFGPGNFYHYYKSYTSSLFETYVSDNDDRSTVHNYFLLTLIEQGWPGFLIFLALVVILFIHGERIYHETKDKRNKSLIMAVLISSLLIMANIFMADLIETDEIGSFFFMNMALIVSQDLRNKRITNNEDPQKFKPIDT